MKKETKIYCQSNNKEISSKEFQQFFKQYEKGIPLKSILLCKRLKDEWWKFIKGSTKDSYSKKYELPKPEDERVPKELKGGSAGIYAIFTQYRTSSKPECFYVGISINDVRSRIRNHLGRDLEDEIHKPKYEYLKNCYAIFICYALLSPKINRNKLKYKLELLEHCLTAILRPQFLINYTK